MHYSAERIPGVRENADRPRGLPDAVLSDSPSFGTAVRLAQAGRLVKEGQRWVLEPRRNCEPALSVVPLRVEPRQRESMDGFYTGDQVLSPRTRLALDDVDAERRPLKRTVRKATLWAKVWCLRLVEQCMAEAVFQVNRARLRFASVTAAVVRIQRWRRAMILKRALLNALPMFRGALRLQRWWRAILRKRERQNYRYSQASVGSIVDFWMAEAGK